MFHDSRVTARENAVAGGLAGREWLVARGNRLNNRPKQGTCHGGEKSSAESGRKLRGRKTGREASTWRLISRAGSETAYSAYRTAASSSRRPWRGYLKVRTGFHTHAGARAHARARIEAASAGTRGVCEGVRCTFGNPGVPLDVHLCIGM